MNKPENINPKVLECKRIETAIRRAQKELETQEYHENFGKDYADAIREKFLTGESGIYEEIARSRIRMFEKWCLQQKPKHAFFHKLIRRIKS